jgi:WXXGXW repeat (2 copies)
MSKGKQVLSFAAAIGLAAFSAAGAVEYSAVEVDAAPPPMRVEVAPPAREGYVWIPGYWDYRDHDYSWVGGHFEREREGFVYVAPRYEEREGHWRVYVGGWDRRGEEERVEPPARVTARPDKRDRD